MVTGIEAAGLALAILPLLANQIDAYARGIEKIKGLRRYRREFKGYSIGLKTQYAILLNTLEQALEGVVNDEDQVSELIRDTKGDGWKDPDLERRLRSKLRREYDVYIENITEICERLERLSRKLEIGTTDMKQSAVTEAWNIWKLRKILDRAVYDDLLAKISEINTVLKTLTDQSDLREDSRKKRQAWHYLLKRYQKAHKHAQGLFNAITGGNYWRCECKEQHCVHLQLQTNPLKDSPEYPNRDVDTGSQFRMIFSNTNQATKTSPWAWAEVEFESWQVENIVQVASLSLHEDSRSGNHKRPRVQFNVTPSAEEPKSLKDITDVPPIVDFCTSLCVFRPNETRRECIGSISNKLDASVKYTMHAVKTLSNPIPQRSLREVLSQISRHDRLHIATGLACGVIQFHDNWLKAWWDSSDVYLAATDDGRNVSLNNLYLPWSFSGLGTIQTPQNGLHQSHTRGNRLLPLGLALVELSLRRPLYEVIEPDEGNHDMPVTRLETVSKLVERVHKESGTNYAGAVSSCLCWSSLCLEKPFEERIFETIISPLLKDLVSF